MKNKNNTRKGIATKHKKLGVKVLSRKTHNTPSKPPLHPVRINDAFVHYTKTLSEKEYERLVDSLTKRQALNLFALEIKHASGNLVV